jgi:hypothetical protein
MSCWPETTGWRGVTPAGEFCDGRRPCRAIRRPRGGLRRRGQPPHWHSRSRRPSRRPAYAGPEGRGRRRDSRPRPAARKSIAPASLRHTGSHLPRFLRGESLKAPGAHHWLPPDDPLKQVARRNREGARKLDERVGAGGTLGPLQLADRRSVKRCPEAKLLLGESDLLPTPTRTPMGDDWATRPEIGPSRPIQSLATTAPNPLACRAEVEWRGPESNRRHHDFQSCALPTELPRLGWPTGLRKRRLASGRRAG